MTDQRLKCIHNNPVEEDLVFEPEHYVYCIARNYAGLPGQMLLSMLN